jgi:CheY-like chemotaxis protein
MCADQQALADTILVVDDDLTVRLIVGRVLEESGHAVCAAPSGHLALAALSAAPRTIGLLLSDVRMPGMNGLDLALEVRRSWPALPILLMSAYEHARDEQPTTYPERLVDSLPATGGLLVRHD